MIETTVRLGRETSDAIARVCVERGVAKSCLVSALVQFASKRMAALPDDRVRVRYQGRRAKGEWRCFHLALRPDEYEFFGDARKVFRVSVSFIIAYAVEHYLDEMLATLGEDADNYRYRNYLIVRFMAGDVVCWAHCWGIPPQVAPDMPALPFPGAE